MRALSDFVMATSLDCHAFTSQQRNPFTSSSVDSIHGNSIGRTKKETHCG
jgi:hypothetical protein